MNANASADDNRVTTAHSVSSRDVGILGRYGRTRIVAVCFHLFHIPFSLARFLCARQAVVCDLITSLLSTTSLRRVCASLCESRQVLLTSPWSHRASSRP